MRMTGTQRLGLLAFIWGWSFLFIKVGVAGFTPTTVAGGRIALGAATVLLLLRRQGVRLPRGRRIWWHFLVGGVVGNVLPFTALAWGEQRITSALTSVLNATTPFWTALIAAAWQREHLRRVQLLGLAIGLGGVAVAAGVGADDLSGSSLTGVLAGLFATSCYGLAINYIRHHFGGIAPMVAVAGQLTMATVVIAPVAVATSIASGFSPTPTRVAAVGVLGVVGTGLAWVISHRMIDDVGPTKASLVTYLIPVVAITVGVVVLDERFSWRLVAGTVLVVSGIAAVHERGPRLPRRSSRSPRLARLTGTIGGGAAVLLIALLLAGCGRGQDPTATTDATPSTAPTACGRAVEEPLDPTSFNHVIPGATEPEYQSDPPTSGPHLPGGDTGGPVLTEPLSRPVQVGQLEAGRVLLQHRALSAAEQADLEALAGPTVLVAPNPDLPDRVVATAWRNRLTCSSVDTAALGDFIAAHAGKTADEHAGHTGG